MMYFKEGSFLSDGPRMSWHVGEPLQPQLARVMSFQADEHELELILDAMRKSGRHDAGMHRKKINPRTHKIDAIKALRDFAKETFGAWGGLKESKDYVESCISNLPPKEYKLFKVGDRFDLPVDSALNHTKKGLWVCIEVSSATYSNHPQILKMVHVRTGAVVEFSGAWCDGSLKGFDKLADLA